MLYEVTVAILVDAVSHVDAVKQAEKDLKQRGLKHDVTEAAMGRLRNLPGVFEVLDAGRIFFRRS